MKKSRNMQKETNQLVFSTIAIPVVIVMWLSLVFVLPKLEGVLNERILISITAFSAMGGILFIIGQIVIILETVIRIIKNRKSKQAETREEKYKDK